MTLFEYLSDFCSASPIINSFCSNIQNYSQIESKFKDLKTIIIFGTGGSSLGGKCLVSCYEFMTGRKSRIIFIENIDEIQFYTQINNLSSQNTGVIVISKSGNTLETLMSFLTMKEIWPQFDFTNHAIAITEYSPNSRLYQVAQDLHMQIFEHHPDIGGRFSVFSNTALIPAKLCGIDINTFIDGARFIIDTQLQSIAQAVEMQSQYFRNPSISQHILITYSEYFEVFGKWFIQLQSETLGKTKNFGWTPLHLTGTTYQHSILQLLLAGPPRSFYTFIRTKPRSNPSPIRPSLLNCTMSELMEYNQSAAIEILSKYSPIRVLDFDSINIHTLGQLMMRMILETIGLAYVSGINPFDQPAVEEIKRIVKYKMEKNK